MRERRPERVAKTTAKAKLAGSTPPGLAAPKKVAPLIAGGPLTQRANANGRDKDKGIQQTVRSIAV